jgi:hypothetical protein
MNYNSSQVGVPYVRVARLTVSYPTPGFAQAEIVQDSAVLLADGSVARIESLPTLTANFDLTNHGDDVIPIVSPDTGMDIGASTTLNTIFLSILAAIRQVQVASN